MSYCLLCDTNYKPQLDFKSLFSLKRQKERSICRNCISNFQRLSQECCLNCNKSGRKVDLCNDCIQWKKQYPGKLLENKSVFRYNQTLHDVMVNYKRYGDYVLHLALSDLIAEFIPAGDYYVPIPTSQSHFERRQFDTITEIYKPLVPLTDILKKNDDGSAQGEKNKQERLETPQTFYVEEKLNLTGTIILLDDIYTTGSTLYHARDAVVKACPDAVIKSFTVAR